MRECQDASQFSIPRVIQELVFILIVAKDLCPVFWRRTIS
jgi:hypothetical protein